MPRFRGIFLPKILPVMTIKIRYFASLRDYLGKSDDLIQIEQPITLLDVWMQANSNKLPDNVLVALNMDYGQLTDLATDNDEVAFFPPVTGG